MTSLQIKQAEIAGDVAHIKARIDNGMSHTIQRMDGNLTKLMPIIEHHADIVRRVEDFGWLISRSLAAGLLVSVLGLLVWAITKGFVPKI